MAAVAWYLTARQATGMGSMATGLAQVGVLMAGSIAAPLFMAMWLGMMAAMMLPAVAPMVLTYRLVTSRRGEGWLPTAAFVVGYIAVWFVIGLVPLAIYLGFSNLAASSSVAKWLPAASGAILVIAGLYQFTPLKAVCLRACRGPLSFVLSHDFGGGSRSGFWAGLTHGAYCLGCCWALMTVLIVVGLMNLIWMAGLAVIFALEKNWSHGVGFDRVVGAALVLLGLTVLIDPNILVVVSGGQPPASPGGHM